MEERIRFIHEYQSDEQTMAALCRIYGVSRKTGYKWLRRYEAEGLSRLSVWWIKLGIMSELITPGHPEQNGIHERMHRTLKEETASPPAGSLKGQQRRFTIWRREFNEERLHEALGLAVPASCYRPSEKEYPRKIEQPEYPDDYKIRRVRSNGEIKWKNRRRFIGDALRGNLVGLVQEDEERYNIYFGPILLGALYDNDEKGIRPSVSISRRAVTIG